MADTIVKPHLKPTAERLFDMLVDGGRHHKDVLLQNCFDDPEADARTLAVHICHMRKALAPQGLGIVCLVDRGKFFYQMVRYIQSPSTE